MRTFIARTIDAFAHLSTAVAQSAYNLAMDFRDATTRRFAIAGAGVFIHLPFTSRSLWIEWREQSVGFGIDKADPANLEFFAGRLQGVLSAEPGSRPVTVEVR